MIVEDDTEDLLRKLGSYYQEIEATGEVVLMSAVVAAKSNGLSREVFLEEAERLWNKVVIVHSAGAQA